MSVTTFLVAAYRNSWNSAGLRCAQARETLNMG